MVNHSFQILPPIIMLRQLTNLPKTDNNDRTRTYVAFKSGSTAVKTCKFMHTNRNKLSTTNKKDAELNRVNFRLTI